MYRLSISCRLILLPSFVHSVPVSFHPYFMVYLPDIAMSAGMIKQAGFLLSDRLADKRQNTQFSLNL